MYVFLFMKLGNTNGHYLMSGKYDSYEDCVKTFQTTISRGLPVGWSSVRP